MTVDRIERHDMVNAVGLTVALLAMALGLVFGARALFNTVNDGLTESTDSQEKIDAAAARAAEEAAAAEGDPAVETDTTTTLPVEETTTTAPAPVIRPPAEVTVRVSNSARRAGVAGAGTEILAQAGYASLSPKNGPTIANSVVYYVEGFDADASAVARLLNMAETAVAPMPADPGIPIDGAQLVIILGEDTTVG